MYLYNEDCRESSWSEGATKGSFAQLEFLGARGFGNNELVKRRQRNPEPRSQPGTFYLAGVPSVASEAFESGCASKYMSFVFKLFSCSEIELMASKPQLGMISFIGISIYYIEPSGERSLPIAFDG